MQTIQCPRCKHTFLNYAAECPECGMTRPRSRRSKLAARLALAISGAALLVTAFIVQSLHREDEVIAPAKIPASAAKRRLTPLVAKGSAKPE